MEKINLRVRKWGNSFGVVLPKTIVAAQKIKEGREIEIFIHTRNKTKAKEIFGMLKEKLKRSTSDVLKEVDMDFENE